MNRHFMQLLATSGLLSALTFNTAQAFSCADTATTGVPEIECEALVALYDSTNGDNWRFNNNWKTATSIDEYWRGVRVESGHVVRVDIPRNRLNGTIPPELQHLGHLTYLDLSHNQLRGEIPPELGDLTNLEYLYLHFNQLSGEIPPELGNLANLTWLWLQNNQLSGEMPSELDSLMNLTWLWLNTNQLSGDIPPELGNLANLERFYLHSNQLSGEIPPELGLLAKLQELYLHDNQLSGKIPPELGNLSRLNGLILSQNQLNGEIPPELGNLSRLTMLMLNNNYLTGDSPTIDLVDFLQDVGTLRVNDNCLNPTDTTIQAILDSKNPGWYTTQTNCLTACQLYAVHDDGLNDSQFFTVDLDDLSIKALGNPYIGYDIESLAIHPQTNKLYATAGDTATTGEAGYLYAVNPETGKLTPIGDTQFAEIEDLAFSPDGTLYGWAKGQGLITIDVTSGQSTLVLASTVALEGLTLSKQAEITIFYGSANGELWRYIPDTDALEVVCSGLQGEIEALEMLSSGELLIGSHETAFGMHLLNPQNCELVMADDRLAHEFNDVEGLAIPIAACQ